MEHPYTLDNQHINPVGLLHGAAAESRIRRRFAYFTHHLRCKGNKFYIKPQHALYHKLIQGCCKGSKFYIKPQLTGLDVPAFPVVKVINSISNHNDAVERR